MSRIITGSAKGARLITPQGSQTRPTTDRVREALFSSLSTWAGTAAEDPAEQLSGLAVLDLFAGSGALGLEAASRGADPVTWVEKDHGVAAVIKQNQKHTRLSGRIVTASVRNFLAQPAAHANDVILLDPPYELTNDELVTLMATALAHGYLLSDGIFVVERSVRVGEPDWPGGLELSWTRRYGESCLYFCRAAEGNKDD